MDYEELLNTPIQLPETLDQLWEAYGVTQDLRFAARVISILDRKDNVRWRLEEWLRDVSHEELMSHIPQMANWVIPIIPHNRTIDKPLDLDLHMALLARDGKLQFNELPIELTHHLDETAYSILKDSGDGIPEYVLAGIFERCGYDYYDEVKRLWKL